MLVDFQNQRSSSGILSPVSPSAVFHSQNPSSPSRYSVAQEPWTGLQSSLSLSLLTHKLEPGTSQGWGVRLSCSHMQSGFQALVWKSPRNPEMCAFLGCRTQFDIRSCPHFLSLASDPAALQPVPRWLPSSITHLVVRGGAAPSSQTVWTVSPVPVGPCSL